MRLGIFGGSFDPVHYGHLLLAESCREQAQLDEVWFVPAAVSPHKLHNAPTPGKPRLEMLELAIGGHAALRVWGREMERGGISYTVDTLREIRAQRPDDELFLLMGGDAVRDFPKWRSPSEILSLAIPLVVQRRGAPPVDFSLLRDLTTAERLAETERLAIEMPLIELSASDLRARVAEGRSIRFRTPRAVEQYIQSHALYSSRK